MTASDLALILVFVLAISGASSLVAWLVMRSALSKVVDQYNTHQKTRYASQLAVETAMADIYRRLPSPKDGPQRGPVTSAPNVVPFHRGPKPPDAP